MSFINFAETHTHAKKATLTQIEISTNLLRINLSNDLVK